MPCSVSKIITTQRGSRHDVQDEFVGRCGVKAGAFLDVDAASKLLAVKYG